jgi:teichuronic acid biosynthesis glycosyltransferase TuaH
MKIFYFSHLDWYVTKQRPQHLAEELSSYYEILYFNILPFSNKEMKPHGNGDVTNRKKIRHNKNMEIRRTRLLPKNSITLIKAFNTVWLKYYIKYFLKINGFEVLWLTHPSQIRYIPKDYPGKIIYDCMDKFDQFSKDKRLIAEFYKDEALIISKSKLLFASSKGLHDDLLSKDAKNVHLLNNATVFDLFSVANRNLKCPAEIDRNVKNVGYFGGIGSWFDVDLLVELALKLTDVNFIIIGPVSEENVKIKCSSVSNIYLLGPKIFSELPNYLAYFDVCLLPFETNELIRYVDPVKVYEYLSAGKPVVAPRYDEIIKFSDYIYISEDRANFCENVLQAMSENDSIIKARRIEFASKNTWFQRAEFAKNKIETL